MGQPMRLFTRLFTGKSFKSFDWSVCTGVHQHCLLVNQNIVYSYTLILLPVNIIAQFIVYKYSLYCGQNIDYYQHVIAQFNVEFGINSTCDALNSIPLRRMLFRALLVLLIPNTTVNSPNAIQGTTRAINPKYHSKLAECYLGHYSCY